MARPKKVRKTEYSTEQKSLALKLWLEGKTDKEICELANIADPNVIRVWRHRNHWEQFKLPPTVVDNEFAHLTLEDVIRNVETVAKGHFYAYRQIRLKVLGELTFAKKPVAILQLAQALDIAVKGERTALGMENKSNDPKEIEINLNFKRPKFQDGKPVADVKGNVIDIEADELDPLDDMEWGEEDLEADDEL